MDSNLNQLTDRLNNFVFIYIKLQKKFQNSVTQFRECIESTTTLRRKYVIIFKVFQSFTNNFVSRNRADLLRVKYIHFLLSQTQKY